MYDQEKEDAIRRRAMGENVPVDINYIREQMAEKRKALQQQQGDKPMITVNIPEGADMNDGLPPLPKEPTIPDLYSLNDGVFSCMPSLLAKAFETLEEKHEKEVFLCGALGVFSAMMPNVYGEYFGFPLGTNLYCFVLGKYGTGKGVLNLARLLGDAVHDYRRERARQLKTEHGKKMVIYNSNLRQYERGESTTAPELPAPPPNHKLYIPANSSKTGIIKLIAENEGRGIIFETEGDSLADMFKQDFGNFSDVLRKAFHHEPISYYRKTGEEEVEIKTPHFSIVLSGTYDQLYKLIPRTENGLYSRFNFYILQGDREFANPFEKSRLNRKPVLEDIGRRWLEVYKQLETLHTPLRFVMPKYQEEKFWLIMKQRKAEVMVNISEKLEGMMHRMGVMFFRTAMILSVLRRYDTGEGWQKEIVCTDTDFELSFEITLWFLQYSLKVYELLPESKVADEMEGMEFTSKEKDREECCRQYKLGHGTREIARMLFGGKKSSTISYWVNKYCKKAS